jgi:hypothetical protein
VIPPDPDEYFAAVSRQFGRVFSDINPPQPLDEAQQEAVEGMFSEGDRDE